MNAAMSNGRKAVIAALVSLLGAAAQGQSASAPTLDIPMADYLGLLAQVAPAAREGAEVYLHAVQRQCQRSLTATQLRRAMSEGNGDPVLMAMIRASHLHDAQSIANLSLRLDCRSLP